VQQQLYLPPCTSFVHKSAEVHQLVQSHSTISVVLVAKSATSRRSPATVEALEGIGWLWGGLGAVRRRPDMVSRVERARNEPDEPKNLTKMFRCVLAIFSTPSYPLKL
jgi:hypothetical protein